MEQVARVADAAGIDSIFVSDHLLQMVPGTDPTEAMLEAYTTLGYLAAVTSQVRLGTMVVLARSRASVSTISSS